LLTSINGLKCGFFFEDGYIRTSSQPFTIDNISNRLIHLTNDAVQKRGEDYGKYENGNKLPLKELNKLLPADYK